MRNLQVILSLTLMLFINVTTATASTSELIYVNQPDSDPQSNQSLPDYGEACNVAIGCKAEFSLACDPLQKICQCSKPDDMAFSVAKGQCLTYVEGRCRYALIDGDSQIRLETTKCVDGAVCNKAGFCQCNLGFIERRASCGGRSCWDKFTCIPSGAFGDNCYSQLECDVTKMLSCIGNTCACFQNGSMLAEPSLDGYGQTCKIKAGFSCENPQLPNSNSTPIIRIFRNEKPKDRIFYGDEKGALRQIRETYATAQCVNGSYCSNETGLCTCSPGLFLDLETGTCALKGLGEDCSSNAECNSTKLLICQGGKCECDPELGVRSPANFVAWWRNFNHAGRSKGEVAKEICLSKVGGNCSIIHYHNNRRGRYVTKPESIPCVVGSDCVLHTNKCGCFEGRESLNENTACGRAFGEICSKTDLCLDRLTCKSNVGSTLMKCGCPNSRYQIYDPSAQTSSGGNGTCRGLVGTICDPIDTFGCVNNSQCAQVVNYNRPTSDNGISKQQPFKCQCNSGYVENATGHCDIEYGQPCNSSMTASCDTFAGLECRVIKKESFLPEGPSEHHQICSCPNTEDVYDKEKRRCGRQENFPCGENADCMMNAACKTDGFYGRGNCVLQSNGEVETSRQDIQIQTSSKSTSDRLI